MLFLYAFLLYIIIFILEFLLLVVLFSKICHVLSSKTINNVVNSHLSNMPI